MKTRRNFLKLALKTLAVGATIAASPSTAIAALKPAIKHQHGTIKPKYKIDQRKNPRHVMLVESGIGKTKNISDVFVREYSKNVMELLGQRGSIIKPKLR